MPAMQEDPVLRRLAAFVCAKREQSLTAAQIEALTIRLIDAMACGALARSEPDSAKIISSFAALAGDDRAGLIGGGFASPGDAAFCNAWLIRKLDWNDTYIGKNGGHPSDFIGAVLAAGQYAGKSGLEVLRAIEIGTHAMLDLSDAAGILARGWDPATYIGIAATAALGSLFDLDEAEIAHALAMTAVSGNTLMARTGRVSSWKSLASAVAVRNSLFHVQLVQRGFSGPDPAFSGETGFERTISGPLLLELDASRDRTGETHLKFYPAIYHAQGPLESCIALHEEIAGAEIEDVSIDIYEFAIRYTADNPAKWAPGNIETADHALPFMVAHALMRGEFGPGSLHATLHDETVRALARRVRVNADKEFSARWPEATVSRVTITAGGRVYTRQIEYIMGHSARPLTLADVRKKFLTCAMPLAGEAGAHAWCVELEAFAEAQDINALLAPTSVQRGG